MEEYIKCSVCKCKYINDDTHIDRDFGYNRLNKRYTTCIKCREKARERRDKQPSRARKIEVEKQVSESSGTSKYCKLCDKVQSIDNFLLFDQPDLRDSCNVLLCGRWLKWKCKSCMSDDEVNTIQQFNGYHNNTIKHCTRCKQDKEPSEFTYKDKPRGFCADCVEKCDWLQ